MYMTRPQARELIQGLRDRLLDKISDVDVVVAPPFTALHVVGDVLAGTGWGLAAQNCFWEAEGAFTGEISPSMLGEMGCRFVILGHSERRQSFGETDDTVHRKLRAAFGHGLTPILCVGEALDQREAGQTMRVVEGQLEGALGGFLGGEAPEWVIAYEPIWAIGTGRTATPRQAQEVHAAIRNWLGDRFSLSRARATRILYGGSVKPENIDELMAQPDIDGALVGGASLKADSFARIVAFRVTAGP
jgi:triosephosphate isomerase